MSAADVGGARWSIDYSADKMWMRAVLQWGVDGGMYGDKMRRVWPIAARRYGAQPADIMAALDATVAWATGGASC